MFNISHPATQTLPICLATNAACDVIPPLAVRIPSDASIPRISSGLVSVRQSTTLPNIELSTAPARRLFVVRITVPYNSVAILAPKWVKNMTLSGQAVMRHE
jgi:hypothetical protein